MNTLVKNKYSTVQLVEMIWKITNELSKFQAKPDKRNCVGNFLSNLAIQETPENLVSKAVEEVGGSKEIFNKLRVEPKLARFSDQEKECVMAVFQLLAKWRDELKTQSHPSSIELNNRIEK